MAINVFAVILAAVAVFVLGMVWYSPAVFGKQWMQLAGLKKKDMSKKKQSMKKAYLWAFISNLVMVYVLARFIDGMVIGDAMVRGLWLWLGFIATVSLGQVLWGGKPLKLWVLKNSYNIVALLLAAGILATWV